MTRLIEPSPGLLAISSDLRLPLVPAGELAGDAGLGPAAAIPTLTSKGILVSRKGCVSLHDASLREVWRWVASGWVDPLAAGRSVFTRALEGRILELDLASGTVLREIPCSQGTVQAAGDDLMVVIRLPDLDGIDRSGRRLWTIEAAATGLLVCSNDRFLVARDVWRLIVCFAADTGEVLWEFRAETTAGGGPTDVSGQVFGLAIAGDHVVAVTRDGRVFALSLGDGRIVRTGIAPFVGIPRITDTSVFFVQPFGYAEFNHLEMKEVFRDEYREAVSPLYGRNSAAVHAFTVTHESLIWTTNHGALLGIGRDRQMPRKTWSHQIPGSIMPIMVHPIVYEDALYYEPKMVQKLLKFSSQAEPTTRV